MKLFVVRTFTKLCDYYVLFEQAHNGHSCVGVQASGGLVKEQDLRLYDELHANVGPLALTTRNTSDKLCANLQKKEAALISAGWSAAVV